MLKSLEDYVSEMEQRGDANAGREGRVDASQVAPQDLWAQLQQKENDLVLAAELGKALLEKNDELKKQQEQIVEEYSKKLEVVEETYYLVI
ncbi:unnamed protein product [Acanthoscelides obtectus]|uniref:HAP1 N-terminal domain-containing protein n=1 Tax=Acanthoscelides obtectus TaxID=200917 RepID=A0A9P0P217_ACAOB|nr:unnamed protein product [Acanthoscelides obtectus]CAK1651758.1 Bicaudal D-related protein homolog [Acanthoscelides obtectus]